MPWFVFLPHINYTTPTGGGVKKYDGGLLNLRAMQLK